MLPYTHKPLRVLLALSILTTTVGGCAGLPRIDPTGQRFLIFPDEYPPIATTPPGGVLTPAPGGAVALAPTTVVPNSTAPPALTDGFLPGTPGSTVTTDMLGRPVVVGPAVGTVVGAPVTAGATPVAVAYGDRLEITPSRILAPVGSEVIVKAGVCNDDGYLLANQRIEWMLGREGAGQIVEVGDRGKHDLGRYPWSVPRKVDANFAIGYTSPYAECLDRGTPDPNDDVEVRRGDAWVSVTSAGEGTSYVTAYAPDVENWQQRTAAATIYWIDAQWAFPPPATVAAGQSHTLTTVVTRQSDGAPVAGWIVRYRVEGGSASLGYGADQTTEMATDSQGRASVVITPTDAQPGTSNIAVEVIRPEQAGVAASPRVTLGSGRTSITWSGMATAPPAIPPIVATPIPSTPPITPSPSTTPPPDSGTPDLDVTIEQITPNPLRVGDTVSFNLTITNRGSATARNVTFVDSFSTGLSHPGAAEGTYAIRSSTTEPLEIAAGGNYSTTVEFQIVAPGTQSHMVSVNADNAAPASRTASINVEGGGSAGGIGVAPSLRVEVLGPLQHNVGEIAQFQIVVENTGTVPATNIQVLNQRDPELSPRVADESYDANLFSTTGQLLWRLAELAPGTRTDFFIQCECVAPAQQACCRVEVNANGLPTALRDEHCTTIRPPISGEVGAPLGGNIPDTGSPAPPSTTPAVDEGLKVEISSTTANPQVQGRFVLSVWITNNSPQTRRNFQLKILIPPQLRADVNNMGSDVAVQPPTQRPDGVELLFGPIAEIAPGGFQSIQIPVDAVQAGVANIYAQRIADGVAPANSQLRIEVIPR